MDVDVERLYRLRLVVARVGEMDLAGWWNTKGQLGSLGASVVSRGLPRTHQFARARSVFAVAAARCRDVYDPPGSVTLWDLPAEVEDELESAAERWRESATEWAAVFRDLEDCGTDLTVELVRFGLASEADVDRVSKLRRSAEQRAVQIPGDFSGSDADLTLLALGFARGETGNLAVPYQAWARPT
ncbi:MAG: BrxE family protein [Hyphomicrobiales bacterium]|nr:BrxE family protein [Hyphomicrobiales bacterium]